MYFSESVWLNYNGALNRGSHEKQPIMEAVTRN